MQFEIANPLFGKGSSLNQFTFTSNNTLESIKIQKSSIFIVADIVEYVPNSVGINNIINKTTGQVSALSFDSGQGQTEKICPFDTLVLVIDGKAEILIDGESNFLKTGQSIIITAHSRHAIKANVRFKMITTVIKSGYED